MAEPVLGRPATREPTEAPGLHDPVLLLGRGPQPPDQITLVSVENPGDDLGAEALTLHAGHPERLLQVLVEPGDALRDHALDPGRQPRPVGRRLGQPATFPVARQVALLPQMAEELQCEERVAPGAPEERVPELPVQPVRHEVDHGLEELPPALFGTAVQVDPHVALVALDLVEHRLEGMALSAPAQGHVGGPVGPDQEDRSVAEPPGEVKEERGGGTIRPVEIV